MVAAVGVECGVLGLHDIYFATAWWAICPVSAHLSDSNFEDQGPSVDDLTMRHLVADVSRTEKVIFQPSGVQFAQESPERRRIQSAAAAAPHIP